MSTTQNLPASRPFDPAAEAEKFRSRLLLFLLLLLALLVVTQLFLPFRLAGIGFALAALWVAVRLLAQLARGRAGAGVRDWVVVLAGLGVAGVVLVMLLAEAAYYPLVSDLESCTAGANTRTAEQACQQASQDRLDHLVTP